MDIGIIVEAIGFIAWFGWWLHGLNGALKRNEEGRR